MKMGGRVSATTAFLGTMLSIKPVMHTSDEGKLVPMSKARGRKASLQALIDKVAELGIEPSEQVMFICQADCEVEARAVAEEPTFFLKVHSGDPQKLFLQIKKNVPRHIRASRAVACDNLHLRASAHLRHAVPVCYRDSHQGLAQARTLARCSRK